MHRRATFSWILDSGGAGRGAWQGGVIHEFMRWTRENGCYPRVSMGSSAGGFAAADVATGTEATVMKGWTQWGKESIPPEERAHPEYRSFWGFGEFRLHLRASIRYVMAATEVSSIFDHAAQRKLLIFCTRLRRGDARPIGTADVLRLFLRAAARKLPRPLKYLPAIYREEPVVFASFLPPSLASPNVRPLTDRNLHRVLEATCLVPLAMGQPLAPPAVLPHGNPAEDASASFMDGGYTLKMPLAMFARDNFRPLASWCATDRSIVFCCDPGGVLWETSFRLRRLNDLPPVARSIQEGRMLVIRPDHPVEAGFLCHSNERIMRTFRRGQEQGERLLRSEVVRRFLESPAPV